MGFESILFSVYIGEEKNQSTISYAIFVQHIALISLISKAFMITKRAWDSSKRGGAWYGPTTAIASYGQKIYIYKLIICNFYLSKNN